MKQRILSILRAILTVLCMVVIVATVYLVGFSTGRGEEARIYDRAYAQAWRDAGQRLVDAGFFPPEPDELRSIAGEITSINGDILTIDAEAVSPNPLVDPGPGTRTVRLSSETAVIGRAEKSSETVAKEEAAFETVLDRSRLAVGDHIVVEAAADIRYTADIDAARIILVVPAPSAQK